MSQFDDAKREIREILNHRKSKSIPPKMVVILRKILKQSESQYKADGSKVSELVVVLAEIRRQLDA